MAWNGHAVECHRWPRTLAPTDVSPCGLPGEETASARSARRRNTRRRGSACGLARRRRRCAAGASGPAGLVLVHIKGVLGRDGHPPLHTPELGSIPAAASGSEYVENRSQGHALVRCRAGPRAAPGGARAHAATPASCARGLGDDRTGCPDPERGLRHEGQRTAPPTPGEEASGERLDGRSRMPVAFRYLSRRGSWSGSGRGCGSGPSRCWLSAICTGSTATCRR